MVVARTRYWRRFKNQLATLCCVLATLLGLLFLISILWILISRGLPYLHPEIFTKVTPAPGEFGGMKNAIIGSVMMTLLAIAIAAPLGILVATFLVEFSGKNRTAKVVRFVNDILLSTPSIVIALFAYSLCVIPLGHFSGFAGAVALAMIALPMIVRASEDVLYLVSPMLKESASALGLPRWRVTAQIVWRVAKDGLLTGSLLALARIAGETAPLFFTALNNQYTNYHMFKPMASLPVMIYEYALSPYTHWQQLAWAAALLMTVAILLLNLLARFISNLGRGR
ncbi:MAG: phosphate ABC transporter permease PstA [Gammaproteobacteria bacterium]|nr:phosphate ABC transporter permease PstA [Gammaproteobacteria bacterium]